MDDATNRRRIQVIGMGVQLSQLCKRCWSGSAAAICAAVVMSAAAVAQTQPSRAAKAPPKFAQAAEKVLAEGRQATLPPHISTLLGLTQEAECPVKQLAVRTANMVQGLDVSVSNNKDVVVFVVDETANDQTLYLTSPIGMLRKVVSVKAGVGAQTRITSENRKAFESEKQFWVGRLASAPASK